MRRKLVAGNWKMNGLRGDLGHVAAIADAAADHPDVDVALCLPATLIAAAVDHAGAMPIGGQDVHQAPSGAHTGCISAAMLAETGARLTIVGHSERRADQGETDADVQGKALAAHGAGLAAILCVGETLEERDAGRAIDVVLSQIDGSLPVNTADGGWLSLAYEPVWAIGTGRTPTAEDVAEMHRAIRGRLRALIGERADAVRILYGGSVNAGNAAELLGCDDVDGALVGGASLTAEKFAPIIAAAAAVR